MACKKCKQKDVLLDALRKDYEKVIKLNGEILELAKIVYNTNKELTAINESLIARVKELENELKEAKGETCSDDSDNA